MQHDHLVEAGERLPGRSFTDPEHTCADAGVMGRMLGRLRLEARSWPGRRTPVELIAYPEAGCRHWLVVPCPSALRKARDVTAVGFFGDLRPEVDHAAIYQLEAEVVERLSRYAPDGLLSYYDAELEPGIHGNLVLFATREVPAAWHGDAVHARAVLLAPRHYRGLRLHRGIIGGPLLGSGDLVVERTRYFDFGQEPAWHGRRLFG
ncbi:MAG TPA: hypothetical protein VGR98_13730 [Streptosporangiaceae bacterium]|nr:hypothetical protein [Streptosporangiaceae bacterium]